MVVVNTSDTADADSLTLGESYTFQINTVSGLPEILPSVPGLQQDILQAGGNLSSSAVSDAL